MEEGGVSDWRDDPAGESMRHGGTGKVYGWPEIKKQGVSSLIH